MGEGTGEHYLNVNAIQVSVVQSEWATCCPHNFVRPSLTSFKPSSLLFPCSLTDPLPPVLMLEGRAHPDGVNTKKPVTAPLVVGGGTAMPSRRALVVDAIQVSAVQSE